MPGTKTGGQRAAATIKARYGEDFYREIGSKGGRTPSNLPKGFAANRELARIAGAKGGRISRKTKQSIRRKSIIRKLAEALNG